MDDPIRILIADDHPAVREGLVALLNGQPDMCVVGEAGNGREAVDLFRHLHPDITLMDLRMPEVDGIEATAVILSEYPAAKVIALSVTDDGQFVQARNTGTAACLLKDVPHEELMATIRAVYHSLPPPMPDPDLRLM